MFDDTFFARPAHLINRAARLMTRLGDSRLKDLGFSTSQLPVLGSLMREGSLPQKTLAERARIEQPSMAQMLARMERDGLVSHRTDPADKRSSLYYLTDPARDRLPALIKAISAGGEQAMAGLSTAEQATLQDLLNRVITNLEAMDS